MKKINLNLKTNPYSIYIGKNLSKSLGIKIKKLNLGNLGLIITTPKIHSLYKNLFRKAFDKKHYKVITVCDGETAKSKKYFLSTINKIVKHDGLKSKLFIVCLGGGTIGDLGGFIAAIYKRGIPFVQIPTTLLAQIDASIGGKTAIDLPCAKNIIGAFYQPKAVYIDPAFLKTLAKRELSQGLAEAIKYALIADKKLFSFFENNHSQIMALNSASILKLISTCAKIKVKVVESDEKETKGKRTILNFGHTLAHALEASLKYQKLNHGEAVSIGMFYAAYLSYLLGKCSKNTLIGVKRILEAYNLPTHIRANPKPILKALSYDKKFTQGKIRMVLLQRIGRVKVVEDIPFELIKKSVSAFFKAPLA